MKVRINRFLSQGGLASRRKCEEFVLSGKVKINGKMILDLSTQVDVQDDVVEVDGKVVSYTDKSPLYIVLNKPRACLTTVSDPLDRSTVMDYCKSFSERLFPVGRLDYLSEGLIILTNDGDFAHEVLHPSSLVEKVYHVKVKGVVSASLLEKISGGVQSTVGPLRPSSVRILSFLPNKTWLEFKLIEGKNREIRRICEHFNLLVEKLKRVAIGGLSIDDLAPGKIRLFSKKQIAKLIFHGHYQSSQKGTTFGKIKQLEKISKMESRNGKTILMANDPHLKNLFFKAKQDRDLIKKKKTF